MEKKLVHDPFQIIHDPIEIFLDPSVVKRWFRLDISIRIMIIFDHFRLSNTYFASSAIPFTFLEPQIKPS